MADHTHHDAVGRSSADDQYLETPAGAGYEHTDASVFIVVKFLMWLGVAAVIIHVGLWLLFDALSARRVERTEPRFPLAVQEAPKLPPEPRLQQFPRADIMNLRISEDDRLRAYGWVDKQGQIVQIPIQDAMRIMLERKMLTSRPQQEVGSDPGLIPADSSSGRTMERRRP